MFRRERSPSDLVGHSPFLDRDLVPGISNDRIGTYSLHSSTESLTRFTDTESVPELSPRSTVVSPTMATMGITCMKISHKSRKRVVFRMDPATFMLSWQQQQSITKKLIGSTKVHDFSIHDVRLVIYGPDASVFREEHNLSAEVEPRWLTLRYYNSRKNRVNLLHLVADTDHDFDRLLSGVVDFQNAHKSMCRHFVDNGPECAVAKYGPEVEMIANKGSVRLKQFLAFSDILQYAQSLNIHLSREKLKTAYDSVASDTKGLSLAEFRRFVAVLKRRPDIEHIFHDIGGEDSLSVEQFTRFVRQIQHERTSDDKVAKIYTRFLTNEKFTSASLNNYLLSRYSKPLASRDESSAKYYSYPLNEYYISSSHNTYLTGRQVAGESSIEGYVRVLQRGCKCVEIDIWDSSSDRDEPVVNHGRTFTSEISLSNVLRTVKQYGFVTSPWPLILSFEVHCSLANQVKVVDLVHSILGEQLVHQPIVEESAMLPSPYELKNKILIKVKRGSLASKLGDTHTDGSSYTTGTTTSFSEDGSENTRRGSSSSLFRRRRRPKVKIDDRLGNLGVYLSGLKFTNFSLPESKTFNHCFSLSEKSFTNMIKDEEKQYAVDKHNRKYFMRIYPSQMRVNSSNFLPISAWAHGAQMVATNWQTFDLGQQINESMFSSHEGYVLKPDSLRKPLLKTSKIIVTRTQMTETIPFKLTVLGAHHLARPRDIQTVNPYVTVEIFGGDYDGDKATYVVSNNGFNPLWNYNFSGTIISNTPQFVFMRVQVFSKNEQEVLLGQTMISLSQLKKGFRYLPLCDGLGEELVYSSIFVRVH